MTAGIGGGIGEPAVTLAFLANEVAIMLAETVELRLELKEIRALLVEQLEQGRRIEQKLDDLHETLKAGKPRFTP